jgi:hypothetical protein
LKALARLSALLSLLALGLAEEGAAQRPLVSAPLDSGTVVRLRLRDGSFEGGKLLAPFGPDSSRFSYCRWPALPCVPGDTRHVVRPAAAALGVDLHRGSGAPLGGAIGGAVGLALAYVYIKLVEYGEEKEVGVGRGIKIVAVTAGLSATFGAVVGGMFHHWAPAP